ncbi:MAG: OmpA family protein [Helicobacteraceae bacterium]|nr:OmpA family protein [Helicobacteraceae bacterium]
MTKLLLFLIFPLFLFSNEDYSIVIKGKFNDSLSDITQDYNGNLSVVGFSEKFSTSIKPKQQTFYNAFDYLASTKDNSAKQIRLIRLNEEGNINLDFSASLSQMNRAVSVIKTPTNGYYIGGYTENGSLLLLKLDASANVIFSKTFGTQSYDQMNQLVALKDGGVLAVGSAITTRSKMDNIFNQGLGVNDIFVTRFSKNGELLWNKKLGTTNDDRGVSATEAYDGTILLIGTSAKGDNREVLLFRLSENGDKIWMQNYKKHKMLNVYSLITLRDQNFLTLLTYYDEKYKEKIKLVKFDLQKNILQETDVDYKGSSKLVDIKESVNNELIAVGQTTNTGKTKALAIKFSKDLLPVWKNVYGTNSRELFNAVTITSDGQYAVAGEKTTSDNEFTNMWVLKLFNDGGIAPKVFNKDSSEVIKALYAQLNIVFAKEIKNGTIKISKNLKITFDYGRFNFKVGEYKLTKEQNEFLAPFSKKLLETLKPYAKYIKRFRVNGFTSSEWKSATSETGYLKNSKLSSARGFEVLSKIYKTNKTDQKWLSKILDNSGNSYADQVKLYNAEDKKASRRVELKIVLN